ncbi:cysteine dioxygenase type 1 [Aethina tumida]|uniref:cysteine dioxygenase type 1 n=1 Tax=Aethina tumida TaxID=116153 RepID=UPI00096AF68E|nr:cysteine dioxygenase type 1 [Aethina tumida]
MSVCQYKTEFDTNNNDDFCEVKLYKQVGGQLPVITNLRSLIDELDRIFECDKVNIDLVHYVMKSYKSNPLDWKKYAKFDRYRYTRNLVDKGNGKYNLLALCWGEGHGSSIHDHANSHCFMKMLQGSLEEIRFAWPEEKGQPLKEIGRTRMNLNDVCYINDSLGLHRVENPSNVDTAISLHLYCPPYSRCHVFNQNTGQTSTSTVTFYSTFGKTIKENKEIVEPEDN